MLRQQMIDGQQIALALKEINLMRQIGAHANVVQFKGLTVRRSQTAYRYISCESFSQ